MAITIHHYPQLVESREAHHECCAKLVGGSCDCQGSAPAPSTAPSPEPSKLRALLDLYDIALSDLAGTMSSLQPRVGIVEGEKAAKALDRLHARRDRIAMLEQEVMHRD